ncbi:MAG: plasmid mobilization relaxosome protein MobC [Lachnospiraceae bacterium]|nr:plasmid mobilization relaxosome protein MobC [Lachnospiraceae bacterium]
MRKRQLRLWLSDDEYSLAYEKSRYLGINMSELLRGFIRNSRPAKPSAAGTQVNGFIINFQTADLKMAITEMNKIGRNLNQVAKHVNDIGAVTKNDFTELKNAYNELFELYINLMTGPSSEAARKQAGAT